MRMETALRRLTKRAEGFFGMTLEQYLQRFVKEDGTLNDNHPLQVAYKRYTQGE